MLSDFVELVERTRGLQPWRRAFHAASGLLLAFAPGALDLPRISVVGVLAALLVAMVAFDVVRLRVHTVNAVFFRLFPSLASPREAARPASSTWYVLSALLVWATSPPEVAIPAILVLGFADPAASVVGRLWGRRRLGKGTFLGATTFLAVALGILSGTGLGWWTLPVALGVTAVEVLPLGLDDNLTVPLAAAALLHLAALGAA